MSPAVIIGILVATSEATSPGTVAAVGALTETLGASSVIVRAKDNVTDDELLRFEERVHATMVVGLTWSGGARRHARLRMHITKAEHERDDRRSREAAWLDRRMSFEPNDSPTERGRAVGLTIAAALLELEGRQTAEASGAPPGTEVAPATPARTPSAPAATEKTAPAKTAPPEKTNATGPAEDAAAPPKNGALKGKGLVLDLAAAGAVGLAGPATGLGGAAHMELGLVADLSLRAGFGLRAGPVPGLDGHVLVASPSAGLAFRPRVTSDRGGRFGFGARLEALLLIHDFSHRDASGDSMHRGRLLPGATFALDGTLRLAAGIDLLVAAGAEIAFGGTDVVVGTRTVATVPPFRMVGEAGVRLHF